MDHIAGLFYFVFNEYKNLNCLSESDTIDIQEKRRIDMSQIAVRVDDQLKKEATAIFNELGLDMSTAVKLFLKQSVLTKSIPFKLTLDEYSKEEVEQAKKDIQKLVKLKSEGVKLDFSKQEDIDKFFGDENFSEYEGMDWKD